MILENDEEPERRLDQTQIFHYNSPEVESKPKTESLKVDRIYVGKKLKAENFI